MFRIRFGTPQSCSVRIRLKKKIKATNVRPYQVHTYVCGDCAVSRKRFMKPESLHWNVLGAVLWKSKNSQFNSISFKMNFYFLLIESEIFVVTSASILRKMKSRYDVTVLRSIVQCFIHILRDDNRTLIRQQIVSLFGRVYACDGAGAEKRKSWTKWWEAHI